MNITELAAQMVAQCIEDGQSVRTVVCDVDAATLRQALRRSAREHKTTVRTARLGDTVALVRTDAEVWNDSAAVMRAKLTPRD